MTSIIGGAVGGVLGGLAALGTMALVWRRWRRLRAERTENVFHSNVLVSSVAESKGMAARELRV